MTASPLLGIAPAEIRRLGRESISVRWSDGHQSVYPNHYLRDHCPCAACRESRPRVAALPVLGGRELYPVQIGVVGRYAINIQWSDQHDSGIYSYETLRALCPCDLCRDGHEVPA